MLERSVKTRYPAGALAFHPEGPPGAFVVAQGLVRAYWSVPDGRQATIAFIHAKELFGATAIISHPPWMFVQVLTDSTLISLDIEVVRRMAATEIEVTRSLATHLAARVRSDFRLIAVRSLGNIKERLTYDIFERACRAQLEMGQLDVRETQSHLAQSIGSSREVVSRTLKSLSSARIIETAPGFVRIVDPVRLAALVRSFVT